MAKFRRYTKYQHKESPLEDDFKKSWENNFTRYRPMIEYRFHDVKRYRFDFAWPKQKVAVEINGYQYHSTRGQMIKDYDKYNLAVSCGWKLFLLMSNHLERKRKVETLREIYNFIEQVDRSKQ